MNVPKISNRELLQLVSTYWQWRALWISSTVAFALLALFYVLFLKGDTWVASQGLIIRDEANGAVVRLGRFESQTAMKAAQETVLEMARNSQVLSDALKTVGPEQSWLPFFATDSEPTNAELEQLAKDGVAVRAPRGAELGTTEVIYLDVMQSSKSRALALNKAVCDALEKRLKQVRQARASGVITELLSAREAAMANLKEATERLRLVESEAGADLSDLRGLTDTVTGGSTTRTALDNVKVEIRKAEMDAQQIEVDLKMVADSFDHPEQLLLTPTKLVNTQPGLKRLREGLSSASIVSSEMAGRYTENHPLVVASRETEKQIREQLRAELGVAVQTLSKELQVAKERMEKLREQQASLETRIQKLAQIRAGYANIASEVRARDGQLQAAEAELAQAEAAHDAAMTSSLITRIDEPLIGEDPLGPGRSMILAGATISGLCFGFGVVFLLAPMDGNVTFGRRRFDYSGAAGRRATDTAVDAISGVDRRARPAEESTPVTSASASSMPEQRTSEDRSGVPVNLLERERGLTITEAIEAERVAALNRSKQQTPSQIAKPSVPMQEVRNEVRATNPSHQPVTTPEKISQSPLSQPNKATSDKKSLEAAQAVIAAALKCSFAQEANAPPRQSR